MTLELINPEGPPAPSTYSHVAVAKRLLRGQARIGTAGHAGSPACPANHGIRSRFRY
jgi:hypothetical protein